MKEEAEQQVRRRIEAERSEEQMRGEMSRMREEVQVLLAELAKVSFLSAVIYQAKAHNLKQRDGASR